MLDLMHRLGFPPCWRAMVSVLYSIDLPRATQWGTWEVHSGRGSRQGDPLSPLLFDIAVNPLQCNMDLHTKSGLLHALPGAAGFWAPCMLTT
jgi:hypothetical protein